jgi:hypothetical protein
MPFVEMAGNFMVFSARCSLLLVLQVPVIMLSYNLSASSLRHSSVPIVMKAAEPTATLKRTDSLRGFPRTRLRTISATMLSPALLTMGTVGGRMCSANVSETARAPAAA